MGGIIADGGLLGKEKMNLFFILIIPDCD